MKWVIVTGLLVTLARFGGGKVLTPLVVSQTSNENIARTLDTDVSTETKTNDVKLLLPPNLTTLSRRVRATDTEKLKVCTPREEFRLDCNTCLCDDEGQSFSCTRIDCYKNGGGRKKRGVSDLQKITLTCNAGSVFERDCNTCRCADEGDHAMCTKKSCQTTTRRPESEKGNTGTDPHNPESDPGFRCNPGEQFKRDCKDCTCSADGKSYFCTLRLCDEFMAPGI